MLNIFTSPLEQFQVFPIDRCANVFMDITVTNATIILILVFFFSAFLFFSLVKAQDSSYFLVPSRWQSVIEIIHKLILSLVHENIKDKKGQLFFPLVFSLFFLLLSINLIGLMPYSFTITSHLIVTLSFSLSIFVGINIICIRRHGMHFFSLFLPAGTSTVLTFLLVPIELISYIFKPISLSIRLFANMMAGHTLLKVIAGFAFTLMGNIGTLFVLHYMPLLILIPLFGLELGVALIQSFVFSILICIYLNDAINLH
jgi:ATP synthase subunit 6